MKVCVERLIQHEVKLSAVLVSRVLCYKHRQHFKCLPGHLVWGAHFKYSNCFNFWQLDYHIVYFVEPIGSFNVTHMINCAVWVRLFSYSVALLS